MLVQAGSTSTGITDESQVESTRYDSSEATGSLARARNNRDDRGKKEALLISFFLRKRCAANR